jgi:hypothetical protein
VEKDSTRAALRFFLPSADLEATFAALADFLAGAFAIVLVE